MTKENAKKSCPCDDLKVADAKANEIKDDDLGSVSGGVRFIENLPTVKDSSSEDN